MTRLQTASPGQDRRWHSPEEMTRAPHSSGSAIGFAGRDDGCKPHHPIGSVKLQTASPDQDR
jgi:hypothetical protein